MSGEELTGRSTDPRYLGVPGPAPVFQPYTLEAWIDPNSITLYKCTDQREGMKLVHTLDLAEMAMISEVWNQLFLFNEK